MFHVRACRSTKAREGERATKARARTSIVFVLPRVPSFGMSQTVIETSLEPGYSKKRNLFLNSRFLNQSAVVKMCVGVVQDRSLGRVVFDHALQKVNNHEVLERARPLQIAATCCTSSLCCCTSSLCRCTSCACNKNDRVKLCNLDSAHLASQRRVGGQVPSGELVP